MKKIFLLISMAAAVSFAGCQKNEIDGVDNANKEGSIFELVANICNDATKTTLDGRTVEWETGDIIYMVTEDEEWGAAYSSENNNLTTIAEFVYADGKFATESRISEGEHTFYAMYSRADQKTWHRGAGSSHSLLATQSQDCSAPTAHIKENDALVGTFTATTPMTAATVNMNHIYTMMQVDVRNNTGAEIEVTKFEMTAAEAALAGVFNIDFTTSTVSPKQNTSSAVTVKVTGGTVANNASLPVYFVMAPLTNYSGKVTFKVTDAKGNTYTKDVILSNVTFEAGKYNTTPYAISAADEVEEGVVKATLTFDDKSKRTEFDTSHQVWVENGITFTNEKGSSTSNVGDYCNPARFYKSSNITISAPGNILALEFDCTGLADQYVTPFSSLEGANSANGVVTITLDGTTNTVTYEKLSAQARAYAVTVTYMEGEGGGNQEPTPEPTPDPTPEELTVAEFLSKEADDNTYYILKGTITSVANTTYGNFDLTDDTGTVYIYGLYNEDGSTDKYWSTSGAKLGDDIVISVPRTDFNGQPQGKNAHFISLTSPGTRAFYTLSTEAVDFSSTGGEQVVTVSAYNTAAAVTASSDNAQFFTVAVDGYDVTISSVANELEEKIEGNVTVTVGNLPATVIKVSLAAKPASGVVEGGQDDFNTISSTNTSYVSGETTAGWEYSNCAIFKGGTSDSSPAFKMIGDASNRALCMNGKTSAQGTITSPTLTTGCGTLKFKYGLPFSDTKIKFSVDIIQNGETVKTYTVENSSATKLTKYSFEETVNVSGDFQIVFKNLSPSNSTSNKDRTAIWDVEWTGFN